MESINQFFATLPPWLGTVPNWINSAGIVGLLFVLAKIYLGKGTLSVESTRVEAEIENKLRDHFGKELLRLAEMSRHAAEAAEAAKTRQRECEQREEALRKRVRKLEDQLTGIVRSLSVEGSLRVLDMTEHPSDDIIKAAISTLENILAKRNRHGK